MHTFCQFVFSSDYVGHRVVLILNLNSYYGMYLSLSISVSLFLSLHFSISASLYYQCQLREKTQKICSNHRFNISG